MMDSALRALMLRCLFVFFLCVSSFARNGNPTNAPVKSPDSILLALIANKYWQREIESSVFHQIQSGVAINDLPDISPRKARQDAAFARYIRRELAAIRPARLEHQDWLTLEILRWRVQQDAQWEKHYWLIFQISPSMSEISTMQGIFADHPFHTQADLDHYVFLLKKCSGFFNQVHNLLKAQVRRGIVYPRDGLPLAIGFISSYLQEPGKSVFFVGQRRLQALDAGLVGPFQQKVAEIIRAEINPAVKDLLDYIKGEYTQKAPDAVGLAQYPGGKEYYRFLVRFATTLDISPEEVHQIGLKAVEQSEAGMEQLRRSIGFTGTREEFNRTIKTDSHFFPKSPEEFEARLMFYLHRIEPLIPTYFSNVPKAPYVIRRLEPRLEQAQPLGHYQRPSAGEPMGIYFFNGATATHTNLLFAGNLMLHELIPGHHFQMALQAENTDLPEFRRTPSEVAFTEGWGDYSGFLGQEMGVYENDYDLYGMMATDVRKGVRLVVDTGMNYLGWSRARAMEYMREHTLDSDSYIDSETLRYGVDFPAQALGYKIGSREFIELREKAKRDLGDKFDIRQFHQCVLENGSMPLGVLAQQVDWCIEQVRAARGASSPKEMDSKNPGPHAFLH
ncbi:MAG TPA: DUF885 domain-containing protein [Candidatus Angelobacter sp.]